GTLSVERNRVYYSERTIWQDVLDKKGNLYRGHFNLGKALYFEGLLDESESHFQEALRILPRSAEVYQNLGALYLNRMEHSEPSSQVALQGKADAFLREAIRLDADGWRAHRMLASSLIVQDKNSQAIEHLTRSLEIA